MFKAHTASVRCVDFASNGQSLLSASDDKTVKVDHNHIRRGREGEGGGGRGREEDLSYNYNNQHVITMMMHTDARESKGSRCVCVPLVFKLTHWVVITAPM